MWNSKKITKQICKGSPILDVGPSF